MTPPAHVCDRAVADVLLDEKLITSRNPNRQTDFETKYIFEQGQCLLQTYFAEIDAGTELGGDCFLGLTGRRDLDNVFTRILVQPVEFEVAVIVGGGLRHHGAALEQAHRRALDAIDDAIRLHRHR